MIKKIVKAFIPFLLLAILLSPFSAYASSSYYTNSSGSKVHVPIASQVIPIGASAKCKDGTFSFSTHRRGTCSGHKGVKTWYK